ncbi:MAG: hypothetical protein ACFFB3_24570 [Candidatus Hodarchaeota archaeon]
MANDNNHDFEEIAEEQLNQEMRRIKAAQAVLKRKGLDFLERLRTEDDPDKYLSVLALWQNEDFLAEVEATVRAELEPDPGGIRRFLVEFESKIEDLDARWLLALWWQASRTRVPDFDLLIKEYQNVYSPDLLHRLETMWKIPGVDPLIRRCLGLWRHIAEQEVINSALASQRTELRQSIANYRFHHQGTDYTARQIASVILREEQNRKLRQKAWNSLVQLSQQMAPKIRKLILQTNASWRERGYVNPSIFRLQVIGVSETVVRQVFASIEARTRPVAQSLLKEYWDLLNHEIMPWDWRFAAGRMAQPFEALFGKKDVIKVAKKTYENVGIDVGQLPIQFVDSSTTHDINHNAVRVPHDIILSYGSISGFREHFALLQVLGEACYFAHIDGDLAYPFRRYAPEVLAKGFATLSSWLMWEYDWLKEFTALTPEQITEFSQQMKNYELLKLRYYNSFALFEMDAYHALADDPEADLDVLYGQHMKKFLLIPTEDCTVWAAEPFLIDPQGRPFFTIYVLGLAVAANLAEYLSESGEPLLSSQFGTLFRSELVQQGASGPWLERLQKLTLKALTPFPMSWLKV